MKKGFFLFFLMIGFIFLVSDVSAQMTATPQIEARQDGTFKQKPVVMDELSNSIKELKDNTLGTTDEVYKKRVLLQLELHIGTLVDLQNGKSVREAYEGNIFRFIDDFPNVYKQKKAAVDVYNKIIFVN